MNQKKFRAYIMKVCEMVPPPTPPEMAEKYRGRVIHVLEDENGQVAFWLQPRELPDDC